MPAKIAPGYELVYNDKGIVIGARKTDGSFTTPQAQDWWGRNGGAAKPSNPAPAPPRPSEVTTVGVAAGLQPIYNAQGVALGARTSSGTFTTPQAEAQWRANGMNPHPPTPSTPGPANGALDLGTGYVTIYGPNGELLGARKPDGSYTTPQAQSADLKTDPVKPFATPQQEAGRIQGTRDYKLGELDIDQGLDTLRADTAYQKTVIDQNLLKDTNQTVDAMIARGLMQSTVKDTAIWDITQTATLRKTYLDSAVTLAEQYGEKRHRIAGDAYKAQFGEDNPDSTYNKEKIQNADEANKTLVPAPRVATPYTPPRSPAPVVKPKPVAKIDATGGVRAPDEW